MSEDLEHELLDRDLRPFVEECDQMQGFQVITGADDAWAGFASKYLEGLRDEFGRKSVWVWGLEEARQAGRVSLIMVRCFTMTADVDLSLRRNVCNKSSIRRGPSRLSLLRPRFTSHFLTSRRVFRHRTSTWRPTQHGAHLPYKLQPTKA